MNNFDVDRTLAEDRTMRAVRRAKVALMKAYRYASRLAKIDVDCDGFDYAGGKMPQIAKDAEEYSKLCNALLLRLEAALDRQIKPSGNGTVRADNQFYDD